MISSEQNINAFYQILRLIKQYIELKTKVLKLDSIEVLSIILSKIILFLALLLPALFVLLFLTIICTIAIAKLVGNNWLIACSIMGLAYTWLGGLIYINRTRWILNPITNFIAQAILNQHHSTASEEENHII